MGMLNIAQPSLSSVIDENEELRASLDRANGLLNQATLDIAVLSRENKQWAADVMGMLRDCPDTVLDRLPSDLRKWILHFEIRCAGERG